jgi:hypothetical protein
MNFNQELSAIVFMKFGYHALENETDIVCRKRDEYKQSGKIFWGYGGTLCHPINQVRPFAMNMQSKGIKVYLAMSFTKSKPQMTGHECKMFSVNNKDWKEIPNGIKVTGSKYAIVCSQLEDCNIRLNLDSYQVAIGPSRGKIASQYIGFRVDKGCLQKLDNTDISSNEVSIQLISEIVEPFAVLLK